MARPSYDDGDDGGSGSRVVMQPALPRMPPALKVLLLANSAIFLVCFLPSLVHIAGRRLLRGRTTDQSVIHEAKAAAYTCVSFAFMG